MALELRGITKRFPGVLANDNVSLSVETGEILTETATKVQGNRENLLEMVIDLGIQIIESADLPPLPQPVVAERKALDYPAEAIQLYSRALRREERGDREGMAELLRELTSSFPQHVEGRQMLEQYGGGDKSAPAPAARRLP